MIEHIVHNNGSLTTTGQCMKDSVLQIIEDFLSLFYILSPIDSTKDNAYDVPDYEVTLLPVISILVLLEQFIRYFQRKDLSRFQDYVINGGSAIMFTLIRVFLLTTAVSIFVWIHTNYHIVDLPLHSVWTWMLSLLLVEFTYYWIHRALHEFNILWAAHQFHHMAEDVNITTTLRDSMVDLIIYAIFPLPLAIIIPPPILMVHIQFSLIYQIWLHNSVIGNLGFLEYIINTPRQHRVHHGKNPYCIDKNYGALIMVWDRMFGTYQTEKEKIIFGVVSPTPKTYDSMILQFGYYRDVWHKFKSVEGIGNKMSAIFKGPGWSPGKPRLGLISDIPEPDPSLPKYSHDPYIPNWKKFYIAYHSVIVVFGFYLLADHTLIRFSPIKGLIGILYTVFILTSFGAIFDNRKWASIIEIVRCLTYYAFDYFLIASVQWPIGPTEYLLMQITLWTIRAGHGLSILFWISFLIISSCKTEDNDNENDSEYSVIKKDMNDFESNTSSDYKMSFYKMISILFCLLLASIPFGFAFILRLKSCKNMFNEFYYLLE